MDSPKSGSTVSNLVSKSSDSPVSPQMARASALLPDLPTLPSPQHPPFVLPACQDSSTAPQKTLPTSVSLPQLQNHGSTTVDTQVINVTCISTRIFHPVPPPSASMKMACLSRRSLIFVSASRPEYLAKWSSVTSDLGLCLLTENEP